MKLINNDWDIILDEEYKKNYFMKLLKFVNNEYMKKSIFPIRSNLFRALELTKFKNVKIVILGQDPYHGVGEANGIAFSVPNNIKIPPSLRNIFKELYNDTGIERTNTDLSDWSKQGVLLLNAILTVEKDKPLSHQNKGWELFTNQIIREINKKEESVIFILWGAFARRKKELIDDKKHIIIESAHPSPLSASRGFLGSKPFSRVNNFLKEKNIQEIRW